METAYRFFSWLLKMDRRIIFLLTGAAVILPFLLPMGLSIHPTKPVKTLYEAVDQIAKDNEKTGKRRPLMLSFDYDPSTMAELAPMAQALVFHAFKRNVPVMVTNFIPTGASLASVTVERLQKKFRETYGIRKKYGEDYIFLGYKPAPHIAMIAMGIDLRQAYQVDSRNKPLDSYPMMKDIKNYDDIGLVVCLSGTGLPETWIQFAVERYKAKFGMGVTAVMASDFYPYLQTGQAVGMLGGMKGAAEYERLLTKNKITKEMGDASKGMDSQSISHMLIVILILLGNIGFFLTQEYQRRLAKK